MKICIDTNAYSALMRGEKSLAALLENADEIHIPVTVLGELYSGFQMGNMMEKNLLELNEFLSKPGVIIIDISKDISFRYGFLVMTLKQQGTPIPANNLWIAAASMDSGSILLSRDSHFKRIPGLQVLDF